MISNKLESEEFYPWDIKVEHSHAVLLFKCDRVSMRILDVRYITTYEEIADWEKMTSWWVGQNINQLSRPEVEIDNDESTKVLDQIMIEITNKANDFRNKTDLMDS